MGGNRDVDRDDFGRYIGKQYIESGVDGACRTLCAASVFRRCGNWCVISGVSNFGESIRNGVCWRDIGTSRSAPASVCLYVVLASNRFDLFNAEKYTFAEAIARLGPEWTAELVKRWQYAVDPRKALDVDS